MGYLINSNLSCSIGKIPVRIEKKAGYLRKDVELDSRVEGGAAAEQPPARNGYQFKKAGEDDRAVRFIFEPG